MKKLINHFKTFFSRTLWSHWLYNYGSIFREYEISEATALVDFINKVEENKINDELASKLKDHLIKGDSLIFGINKEGQIDLQKRTF